MEPAEYQKMFELEDSHFWFLGKRLFAKSLLDKYLSKNKKIKILDLGCGTGGLTGFLKIYGRVTGIEKNSLAIKLAGSRNLKVVKGDIQKIPITNNLFDLITIFDVLYHKSIKDEEIVLLEAKRVLKKGGCLLIADSAFPFLTSYHDRFLSGNKRFTINYLESLLKKNNFKIIKSSYVYFFIFPLVLFKRKIIDSIYSSQSSDVNKIPALINNLLIIILKIEARLLKSVRFPWGSSLIILSQKS